MGRRATHVRLPSYASWGRGLGWSGLGWATLPSRIGILGHFKRFKERIKWPIFLLDVLCL